MLFEPDTKVNYALDSYGLSTIQSSPIKEEGEQVEEKIIEEKVEEKTKKEEPIVVEEKILKKEDQKVAEKKITEKSENQKKPTPPPVVEQSELQDSGEEKKRSKKWMVAAAILILIASGTGWVAYQNNFTLPSHINYADLNPFNKSNESSIFSLRGSYPEYAVIEEESIKDKMIAAEEEADSKYLEVAFVKEPETLTFAELKPKPVAVSKKTSPPSAAASKNNSSLKFHIIGGCFSKKGNAERLVKDLQKKGFSAWMVGERKGLYLVSYTSYATKEEALENLATVKKDNPKAWIVQK